jgi:hypothetical protein
VHCFDDEKLEKLYFFNVIFSLAVEHCDSVYRRRARILDMAEA